MRVARSIPVDERLLAAERLHLFLDYDGTLANFAPTPEHVEPDPELAGLIQRLVREPRLRVSVVSGRRLDHVRRLVPVPGVLLAGTYGIELQTPSGRRVDRLDLEQVRPLLDDLKPRWAALIAGRQGFFLEDKLWALALHARFAADEESAEVLAAARGLARDAQDGAASGLFRVLGGHKFLELGPALAHKGQTVAYLLDRYPWPGALPVYLGDDDKDEEAYGVIQERGGIALVVASQPRDTRADLRLASPQAARRWLAELLT